MLWSISSLLEFIHRACQVGERQGRSWTDFITGERSAFLQYEIRTGAFIARNRSMQLPSGSATSGGGIGSVAREARRKGNRDLDGEAPPVPSLPMTPFRPSALPDESYCTMPVIYTVPAVPPLGVRDPSAASSYTVPHLTLSPATLAQFRSSCTRLDQRPGVVGRSKGSSARKRAGF